MDIAERRLPAPVCPEQRRGSPRTIAGLACVAVLLTSISGCGSETSASDDGDPAASPVGETDLTAGRIVWVIIPGDRLQPLLDEIAVLLDGTSGPENVRKVGMAPSYMSVGDSQVFEFPISYKFTHARLRIELIIDTVETIDVRFMSDSNLTGEINQIVEQYKKQWQYEKQGPVSLGTFRIMDYDPASRTRLRIEFYLGGETTFDDREEFKHFMETHGRTIQESVMVAVRNSMPDVSDEEDQERLARLLVVAINRAVGRDFLKSATIKGLSVYESFEGSTFVKRDDDSAPAIRPFKYHRPTASAAQPTTGKAP